MLESRHLRRLNLRHAHRPPEFCANRSNPLVICVALLALAIQLFVIQTHVHGPSFRDARDSVTASGTAPAGITHSPDRFPPKDDPADCPLCQAFAHSGGYVLSTHIIAFLTSSACGATWVDFAALPPGLHVPHFWFGRAPPPKA
jgi:hypothetical protein